MRMRLNDFVYLKRRRKNRRIRENSDKKKLIGGRKRIKKELKKISIGHCFSLFQSFY